MRLEDNARSTLKLAEDLIKKLNGPVRERWGRASLQGRSLDNTVSTNTIRQHSGAKDDYAPCVTNCGQFRAARTVRIPVTNSGNRLLSGRSTYSSTRGTFGRQDLINLPLKYLHKISDTYRYHPRIGLPIDLMAEFKHPLTVFRAHSQFCGSGCLSTQTVRSHPASLFLPLPPRLPQLDR